MKKKIIILITMIFTIFPVFADCTEMPLTSCNNSGGIATKCGLPAGLAYMINDAYNLIKILVPITLIILGMIDMLKAVASQKDDEIKKGWSTLIRRTIYGVCVYFVFFLIQLIISLLPSSSGKDNIISCTKEFFVKKTDNVCCITSGANTNNPEGGSNETSKDGKYSKY